jgi:hypothetical protein
MAGRSCKSALFGKPSPSLRHCQVRRSSASLLISDSCVDPPSVAQFALSALKSFHAILSEDDQYHMYQTSTRALTAAKRRGETRLIDYWSGRPVVSIELLLYVIVKKTRRRLVNTTSCRSPPSRALVENSISVLARRRSEDAGKLPQMSGPFLYDPRKSVTTKVRWQRQFITYRILIGHS